MTEADSLQFALTAAGQLRYPVVDSDELANPVDGDHSTTNTIVVARSTNGQIPIQSVTGRDPSNVFLTAADEAPTLVQFLLQHFRATVTVVQGYPRAHDELCMSAVIGQTRVWVVSLSAASMALNSAADWLRLSGLNGAYPVCLTQFEFWQPTTASGHAKETLLLKNAVHQVRRLSCSTVRVSTTAPNDSSVTQSQDLSQSLALAIRSIAGTSRTSHQPKMSTSDKTRVLEAHFRTALRGSKYKGDGSENLHALTQQVEKYDTADEYSNLRDVAFNRLVLDTFLRRFCEPEPAQFLHMRLEAWKRNKTPDSCPKGAEWIGWLTQRFTTRGACSESIHDLCDELRNHHDPNPAKMIQRVWQIFGDMERIQTDVSARHRPLPGKSMLQDISSNSQSRRLFKLVLRYSEACNRERVAEFYGRGPTQRKAHTNSAIYDTAADFELNYRKLFQRMLAHHEQATARRYEEEGTTYVSPDDQDPWQLPLKTLREMICASWTDEKWGPRLTGEPLRMESREKLLANLGIWRAGDLLPRTVPFVLSTEDKALFKELGVDASSTSLGQPPVEFGGVNNPHQPSPGPAGSVPDRDPELTTRLYSLCNGTPMRNVFHNHHRLYDTQKGLATVAQYMAKRLHGPVPTGVSNWLVQLAGSKCIMCNRECTQNIFNCSACRPGAAPFTAGVTPQDSGCYGTGLTSALPFNAPKADKDKHRVSVDQGSSSQFTWHFRGFYGWDLRDPNMQNACPTDLPSTAGQRPPRTTSRGNTRACYNCGENHNHYDCPHPDRNSGDKYKMCFTCGLTGHMQRDCPTPDNRVRSSAGATNDHRNQHGQIDSKFATKKASMPYGPSKSLHPGISAGSIVPEAVDDFKSGTLQAKSSFTNAELEAFERKVGVAVCYDPTASLPTFAPGIVGAIVAAVVDPNPGKIAKRSKRSARARSGNGRQ
jgi:hypothetical protein